MQHLDETSGTHFDSTVNDNDGVCVGGVDQNAVGIANGADSFDGSDDYVDCGNDSSLSITDNLTLCVWVKQAGSMYDQFSLIKKLFIRY